MQTAYTQRPKANLPVGNFKFLDEDEIRNFDLMTIPPDAPTGYIVECDLQYPDHLHDLHNDYPMAAEHLTISREMLSPFATSLLDPRRPWKPSKKTYTESDGQNKIRDPLS